MLAHQEKKVAGMTVGGSEVSMRDNGSLRDAVLEYLGGRCEYCGSYDNLHIHHIIPLELGGRNSLGNLEIACSKCHHKLHKQISELHPGIEIKVESKTKQEQRRVAISSLKYLAERGLIDVSKFPSDIRSMISE